MTEYICATEKWGDTFDEPVIRWNEPIVRCRDCKNAHEVNDKHLRKQGKLDCSHFAQWDYYDDQPGIWLVEPDGFCSWGERKDE